MCILTARPAGGLRKSFLRGIYFVDDDIISLKQNPSSDFCHRVGSKLNFIVFCGAFVEVRKNSFNPKVCGQ